jgi:hypothetical protein
MSSRSRGPDARKHGRSQVGDPVHLSARAVAGATLTSRPSPAARSPLSGTRRKTGFLSRSAGSVCMTMPSSSWRRMPSLRRIRMMAWSRAVSKSRALPPPVTSSRSSMKAGGEGLGSSPDFGVAVECGRVGGGVPVFVLQVVEQLDQVALLGVGAALAVGLVVLAEVPVEHRGVDGSEVTIQSVGGHPGVEGLRGKDVGVDRGVFVRPAVPVVDRAQVVAELGEGQRARVRRRRL